MKKSKDDKNEIIINVLKKEEKKPQKKVVKKKKTKKNKAGKQTARKKVEKNKNRLKVLKWTSLSILIITAIFLFMMSSIFNIKEIEVSNNFKISKTEIINNSRIQIGQNIFKINKKNIKQNIKKNAYIEDVKISRDIINMTLKLEIQEREVTYMIKYANAYVYLNNQGYILEISDESKEKPILIGTDTKTEDMEVGNRLNNTDLMKLEGVLKIVEAIKNYDIDDLITEIDISDEKMYTINFLDGEKIVYFGNSSNANEKAMLIQKMLEVEEKTNGEFFVNKMDEGEDVFFRERV